MKQQRGRMSRRVLSGSERETQEDAALDFLDAIEELFPDRFAEIGRLYQAFETPYDDEENGEADDDITQLQEPAAEWARRHHIFCDAVADVAWQIAAGFLGSSPALTRHFDKDGRMIELPAITALPNEETVEEFVARAKEHYGDMRKWFLQRGYKQRPVKREREHFKYLAAHLVGEFSWAQIAAGKTGLPLSIRTASTVAEEARKAALLIGLPMPPKPGPRLGSRMPRNRRRPRRA